RDRGDVVLPLLLELDRVLRAELREQVLADVLGADGPAPAARVDLEPLLERVQALEEARERLRVLAVLVVVEEEDERPGVRVLDAVELLALQEEQLLERRVAPRARLVRDLFRPGRGLLRLPDLDRLLHRQHPVELELARVDRDLPVLVALDPRRPEV